MKIVSLKICIIIASRAGRAGVEREGAVACEDTAPFCRSLSINRIPVINGHNYARMKTKYIYFVVTNMFCTEK